MRHPLRYIGLNFQSMTANSLLGNCREAFPVREMSTRPDWHYETSSCARLMFRNKTISYTPSVYPRYDTDILHSLFFDKQPRAFYK